MKRNERPSSRMTKSRKGINRIKPIAIYEPDGVTLIDRYPSIIEASYALGISDSAVSQRIYGKVKNEKRIFKFDNPKDDVRINPTQNPQSPPKSKNRKIISMSYETRFNHVCVTPCPFRDSKPMIGSAACQACSLFRGVNKSLHIVSCAHTERSPINIK